MKSSTVSVVGRPSSGKSTLVNSICEMKVSITSPIPQTTRNKIRGIYTDQRGQLVFTDTPGFHLSNKEINKRMQETAVSSLKESDLVLYVLDVTRKIGEEEIELSKIVKEASTCPVIALNKIDLAKEDDIKDKKDYIKSLFPSSPICPCSALIDEGLDEILIELFKIAKEGELMYPEDKYTDQDLEFRVGEIIREKAMEGLSDELPHVLFVDVSDLEYNKERNHVWIRAFINVEREGQKGFIVGRGGANIKRIGTEARRELKTIFPNSTVRLDLQVKTQEKWRNNKTIVDKVFKA